MYGASLLPFSSPSTVKRFKRGPLKEECDCKQHLPLKVSGWAHEQCPTHYCPVCKVPFWLIPIKPTAAQIVKEKGFHPDANEGNMTYEAYKRLPIPRWGMTPENVKIDQLGKHMPDFMTPKQRRFWSNLYCEKYPNSPRAIQRKESGLWVPKKPSEV